MVNVQREMKIEEHSGTADGVQAGTAILERSQIVSSHINCVSLLSICSEGVDAENLTGMCKKNLSFPSVFLSFTTHRMLHF